MGTREVAEAQRKLYTLLAAGVRVPFRDFAAALDMNPTAARVKIWIIVDRHDCLTELAESYTVRGATPAERRTSTNLVFERLGLAPPESPPTASAPTTSLPSSASRRAPDTAYPWSKPPQTLPRPLTPAELSTRCIAVLDLPLNAYRIVWSKSTLPVGLRVAHVFRVAKADEARVRWCEGVVVFDRDDRVVVAFDAPDVPPEEG